jgi:DNA-binding PadR family transcriptional regulator
MRLGARVAIYRSSIYNDRVTEVREPTFLVLVALAQDRRHGYGIIQDVERLSNGKTTLRAGTLYATLDRLTAEGLIENAGEEIVDGRLRRYYRLTMRGSSTLEAESKQRLVVAKEALRRLSRPSGRKPRLAGGYA